MVKLAYGSGNEAGLPIIDLPSAGGNAPLEEPPQDGIPTITIHPNSAEQPPIVEEQEPGLLEGETPVEPELGAQTSYTNEIQTALNEGYSKEEVSTFLQSKGLSVDDADLAVVGSVKSKVNEAKAEGYSEEEITSFMTNAGYDDQLVVNALKASGVNEKYRDLDYKSEELTEEDKAMDLSDLYTNIYSKYSTTGKQAVGLFDEETAIEARKEINQLNYNIVEKLKSEGINAFIDEDGGEVMMKNKEGVTTEVDSSFLQSMWNSKGELGGAISGGIAGARAGAAIGSVVPGIGTAIGVGVGAIGGSAIGSSIGRALDLTINAQKLSEDLTASLYMTQMKQAGIFDATMGILIPTAFKIGAKGYKSLAKGYKYFSHGNTKGAYKALKHNLDITDGEAKAILQEWERFNTVEAGGNSLEENIIYAVARTTQGAENVVKTAAAQNARVSTMLKQSIDARAKGVHKAVNDLAGENTGNLVKESLAAYRADVKQFFGLIKKQGADAIDGTDFVFDLDKLAIAPVLRTIEKKLSNPVAKERFVSHAMRIENASADRSFSGLLELRSAVNDFKYSETLSSPDLAAINTVINKIDGQIGKAVKEYMPTDGKTWMGNFKLAKAEYSQMKRLEENALYKQLDRPGATEENLQKAISKYSKDKDVDTELFNKVVERLSPSVRAKTEGAAIRNSVNRWTHGGGTESQAINFPALAEELAGLNLKTKKAKGLQKVVQGIADVYKNDPSLAAIAGRPTMGRSQATLSDDVTQKAKYALVGTIWDSIVRYAPTKGANNMALVHQLTKLFDNPLHVKTVDDLVKQLPVEKKEMARSLVKDLQIQTARKGPAAKQATANMYKQTTTGKLTPTSGVLGKGVYLVDKVKNPIAGRKIVKQAIDPSTMATLDDISSLVGKNVDVKDIRALPNLQEQLTEKGFKGIKVGDKAVLFSDKVKPSVIKETAKKERVKPFEAVKHDKLYHGSNQQRFASSIRGSDGFVYLSPSKGMVEEVFSEGAVSQFKSSANLLDALKDKKFISFLRKETGNSSLGDEEIVVDSLTGAGNSSGINVSKAKLASYLKSVGADGFEVGGEVLIPNELVAKVLKDN